MSGCWVMVCGPSGAGKDSVLAWARDALMGHRRICFADRLVTRASRAGSEHEEISAADLHALRRAGGLAWQWQAHGLHYGIRAEYGRCVAAGEVVVVNGSREHAQPLAGRGDVRVVLVTAAASLLAQRLLLRGREDAAGVALRLHRNEAMQPMDADRIIDNGAALHVAGAALRDYLLELAG
jgi:phosphonate metabolism protein PhnN/1,5-bisphosphokinase (PRPP-forming)